MKVNSPASTQATSSLSWCRWRSACGAGRQGFLEHHDALIGLAAEELHGKGAAGRRRSRNACRRPRVRQSLLLCSCRCPPPVREEQDQRHILNTSPDSSARSPARGERIVRVQGGRPLEPDARQIGREHVLAFRSDAALDPGDEVVERLLARLAVDAAVTRAHASHAARAGGPSRRRSCGAGTTARGSAAPRRRRSRAA